MMRLLLLKLKAIWFNWPLNIDRHSQTTKNSQQNALKCLVT